MRARRGRRPDRVALVCRHASKQLTLQGAGFLLADGKAAVVARLVNLGRGAGEDEVKNDTGTRNQAWQGSFFISAPAHADVVEVGGVGAGDLAVDVAGAVAAGCLGERKGKEAAVSAHFETGESNRNAVLMYCGYQGDRREREGGERERKDKGKGKREGEKRDAHGETKKNRILFCFRTFRALSLSLFFILYTKTAARRNAFTVCGYCGRSAAEERERQRAKGKGEKQGEKKRISRSLSLVFAWAPWAAGLTGGDGGERKERKRDEHVRLVGHGRGAGGGKVGERSEAGDAVTAAGSDTLASGF